MKFRALALVLALSGASALHAASVTYTFSGTAFGPGNGAFQLSHTSDHFLAAFETQSFTLSDVVVDPWGTGGTQALTQCVSSSAGDFGAIGPFVTFGGVCFWNGAAGSSSAFNALSDDIQVTQNTAGTWFNSAQDLQLTVTVTDTTAGTDVPEPASLALVGAALAGVVVVRRRKQKGA